MFFGNSKLEEELAQKEKLINKIKLEITKLKVEHKEELQTLRKELRSVTKELENLKIKHKDFVDKVEASTNLDLMSGAHNKRYLYDIVESMISLAKRDKTSLSLALIEIEQSSVLKPEDKSWNDVVQAFVHKVSSQIRECDVFVRLERTKFVIVFPHTSLEKAKKVSEKLKMSVEKKPLIGEQCYGVKISTVEFLENENINNVLKKAEEDLKNL